MPIYEYTCNECSHQEELIQRFNDKPPVKCPKCKKKGTMLKNVSNSAFHLKGGGWYKDLYSSKKKNDPPKDQKKDTKTEEKKNTKTDK